MFHDVVAGEFGEIEPVAGDVGGVGLAFVPALDPWHGAVPLDDSALDLADGAGIDERFVADVFGDVAALGAGDDVHIHSQCRQLKGSYGRVGELFTGTEGVCYGGGKLKGKAVEVPEFKMDSDNGQVQEHVDMIRSVMTGNPLNDARRIAESTLVAIMGRISAYTGEIVRWNDLLENDRSPFYNQVCTPAAIDFEKGEVKAPAEVPPVPGKA